MRNRVAEIRSFGDADFGKSTGFQGLPAIDFSKIRIGAKTLDDAILNLGSFRKINNNFDKEKVLKAIYDYDLKTMRTISDFFYKASGIYARIIKYMAFMYRYDWLVTPYVNEEKVDKPKLLKKFHKCLTTLDNFYVKKTLGEIAKQVMLHGAYYGYKVETNNTIVLQELPVNYCRSRFFQGNRPAVEFNMKFFDDNFRDTVTRNKILKMFPKEFTKGYALYRKGQLPPDFQGDTAGWYLLDPDKTVKFTVDGADYPMFISVIPLIIDLDEAQALDKKKTLQRLMKILIQKLPLDKNGELIFDPDEAQQMHNNAVQMLSRAIGIDVLTTFADVEVADTDSSRAESQTDDLIRVERQLYNEAGVSQMQFNTDGNMALEKSILNDEASIYNMLLQFEQFLNELVSQYNDSKITFRVQLLTTTIYNYKELAKLYKEQVTLGYSKMLPQIALGQSQSSVLANAFFENDVLDLANVFIPPMQSSTMNVEALNRTKNAGGGSSGNKAGNSDGKTGRPEKPDDEKSTKTIQNIESKN